MSWLQAEVLLAEFWDPASGAVFSEEGDQQRFWKLTRRFVEGLAAGGAAQPARVKVVSPRLAVPVPCLGTVVVDPPLSDGPVAGTA